MLEARNFLKMLWPEELPGALNLWRKGKGSRWFDSIDTAIDWLQGVEQTCDVYYGAALMPPGLEPSTRGTSMTAVAIPGFWLDMDFTTGAHRKTGLPTQEQADAYISDLPLRPTATVTTGGGYHLYWIFEEPWIFEDHDEREIATQLSAGWQAHVRSLMNGHSLDSTWDLARVLRLPGVLNHKYGVVTRAAVAPTGCRYNPSDFEPYSVELDLRKEDRGERDFEEVDLHAGADPPDRFADLLKRDSEVKRLWETRKPKGKTDPSQSAADLALANMLAARNYSPQEVADTIIAWRRENNEQPTKALRWNYTKTAVLRPAFADYAARLVLGEVQRKGEVTESDRGTIRDGVRETLRFPALRRIIQYGDGMGSMYHLELEGGQRVFVGSTKEIRSVAAWDAALFSHRINWEAPTSKEWRQIRPMLLTLVEPASEEESESSMEDVLLILRKLRKEIFPKAAALSSGGCFEEDGALFFRLEKFRSRAQAEKMFDLAKRNFAGTVLRGQLGGSSQSVYNDGSTLNYFKVPTSVI